MKKLKILALFGLVIILNSNVVLADSVFADIREDNNLTNLEEYFEPQRKEDFDFDKYFNQKLEEELNKIEEPAMAPIEETEEVQEEVEIEVITPEGISFEIPDYPGMKKWMSYKVFSSSTPQGQLQSMAYTDSFGCRMIGQRYCVAIGTRYGAQIGQFFDLRLQNGAVIPCIMSDAKSPQHTDSTNTFSNTTPNLCASEFVVDIDVLENECKKRGDMSFLYPEWGSPVAEVILYELNVFNGD